MLGIQPSVGIGKTTYAAAGSTWSCGCRSPLAALVAAFCSAWLSARGRRLTQSVPDPGVVDDQAVFVEQEIGHEIPGS